MKNIFNTSVLALAMMSAYSGSTQASEAGNFYVEAFGGFTDSASGSPDGGNTAGASYIGQMTSIDLDHNSLYGMRFGYEISSRWRVDLSYYDMSGDLEWTTIFPGCCTGQFTADLDSRVILASAYYSFATESAFKPYVGIGLGNSRNEFHDAKEYFSNGVLGAYPAKNTSSNFAYRVAVGADYAFSEQWKLNLDLSFMDLGDASSGTTRTFVGGGVQPIGRYEFDKVQRAIFSVGLKYSF